jgi:hypothetical protein
MSGADAGSGFFSVDGSPQMIVPSVGASNPTPTWLLVGMWSGGGFFNGEIGELIIFDRALTAPERLDVNAYLGEKWAVAMPTGGDPGRGLNIVEGNCIPEPSTVWLVCPAIAILTSFRLPRGRVFFPRCQFANSITPMSRQSRPCGS